jgi:hypothetical protein
LTRRNRYPWVPAKSTVPTQMFMAHFIWFPKLNAQGWSHRDLAKL